jgi:hypothetical protein
MDLHAASSVAVARTGAMLTICAMLFRRLKPRIGDVPFAAARCLADVERVHGHVPDGCRWLDSRTVDDLELPLVFSTIDRTASTSGAQALWRWLAAPAIRRDVVMDRDARIARVAARDDRDYVRRRIGALPIAGDGSDLPELLWGDASPAIPARRIAFQLGLLVASIVLAWWWPVVLVVTAIVIAINVLTDDWASIEIARPARALGALADVLATAEACDRDGELGDDLAHLAPLRRQVRLLSLTDPFGLVELIRAALLGRQLVVAACAARVARDRARLQRVVLWLGELDAALAIADLRAERADARVPELVDGSPRIIARDLVHPAIAGAVANSVELAGFGLVVTGSNMSGKSTFLRTVAINAICAQSIATTFGSWEATVFRVRATMRVADDTARGTSTFAAEVAAIGEQIARARRDDAEPPALFVLDEPFRGTNPAIRVPIAIAVVDYLGARDLAVVATHDLDVAAQLDARFGRVYFDESDHVLRPGVAPAINAVALLAAAEYPEAILAEIRRRVGSPSSS